MGMVPQQGAITVDLSDYANKKKAEKAAIEAQKAKNRDQAKQEKAKQEKAKQEKAKPNQPKSNQAKQDPKKTNHQPEQKNKEKH